MENKMILILRSALIVLFLSVLTVGDGIGASAGVSDEERVLTLIEGAKAEGKLALYTSQSIPDISRMIKKYEEMYPFIKVELYRAQPNTLISKISNESKAKKYIADIVELSGFYSAVLKKERFYARYISPENRAYPEGFKDTAGNWTSTYIMPYLMGYNTKLLSRKDIPDTYEGFLNPRWKGKKIGFDTREVEWFANMLKIMGEEKGLDYFRKLAAQELDYRNGHTLIADLMIAGEFPVGTIYVQTVEERKKKGAKIDWVGVAPVVAKLGNIGLVAHGPHPNAAKLYIDFILSKKGQMTYSECGKLPARPDVEADNLKAFKGIKLYPSDLSLAENYVAYSKQFAEVLRLR